MEGKCYLCNAQAEYVCFCRFPITLICNDHIQEHESCPIGIHDLKNYPMLINEKSRELILNRINELIEDNKKIQNDIKEKGEREFAKIYDMLNEISEKFNDIIYKKLEILQNQLTEMNTLHTKISSLQSISPKSFFCPFEKSLLDPIYMESLISSTSSYSCKFKTINLEKLISLTPSNLFSSLSQFSFLADLQDNLIRIKSKESPLIFNIDVNLPSSSRLFKLSSSSVLITGGANFDRLAFELDFKDSKKINLPVLNFPRQEHAMAWVDNMPAVLGGTDGVKALDSVEVFSGFKWEVVAAMKRQRLGLVATNHLDMVFVVGGHQSLEFYSNKTWKEIHIAPSIQIYPKSLFYSNNNLIVLGLNKSYSIEVNFESSEGKLEEIEIDAIQPGLISKDLVYHKGMFKFIHNQKDMTVKYKLDFW